VKIFKTFRREWWQSAHRNILGGQRALWGVYNSASETEAAAGASRKRTRPALRRSSGASSGVHYDEDPLALGINSNCVDREQQVIAGREILPSSAVFPAVTVVPMIRNRRSPGSG
jgi:hypothetical protein